MWTRSEIKELAKATLKYDYWKLFIVGLVLSFVSFSEKGFKINFNGTVHNNGTQVVENSQQLSPFQWLFNPQTAFYSLLAISAAALVITALIIFVLGMRIFIFAPVEVGCKKFFVDASERKIDLNTMGFAFKDNRYRNIVRTMFSVDIRIVLWSFLLIVPGVIKSYEYRMVPYILSENPEMDASEARALSSEMTYGEKMNIFVLDLSFIGWYILGGLLFGIGQLFVHPYAYATDAELYKILKQELMTIDSVKL